MTLIRHVPPCDDPECMPCWWDALDREMYNSEALSHLLRACNRKLRKENRRLERIRDRLAAILVERRRAWRDMRDSL